MTRKAWKLVAAALILSGAGIAAAQSSLIDGPSPGIALSIAPTTQVAPPITATDGVTTTTTGDTTTITAQGSATTTTPTTTPTTVPGTVPSVQQVVSLTQTVNAGAPVSVFAVPSGSTLVLTDVIVTNPGTTPSCGAGVAAGGAATTATPGASTTPGTTTTGATTTGAATTTTAGTLANTGVLCVPPQTSLVLTLTTGLEFASGQSVVVTNQTSTTTGSAAAGPLSYHLRGFLIANAV